MKKYILFLLLLLVIPSIYADQFNPFPSTGYSFGTQTAKAGWDINTNTSINLTHIVMPTGGSTYATNWYVLANDNTTTLATGSNVSGLIFTVNNGLILNASTRYLIVVDRAASSFFPGYRNPSTFPVSNASLTLNGAWHPGQFRTTAENYAIASINFSNVTTTTFQITATNRFNSSAIQSFNASIQTAEQYQYAIQDGLVAWYRLDDNLSTNIVLDSSGLGNNGNSTSGTATNYSTTSLSAVGIINKSFSFPNPSQNVSIRHSVLPIVNKTSYTYSVWFNARDLSNLATTPYRLAGQEVTNSWWITFTSSTQIRITFRNSSGSDIALTYVGFPYQINTWYNYAIDVEGTNASLFINGEFLNTTTLSHNFTFNPTSQVSFFGAAGNNPNRQFNGSIDDVQIYNRSLTATEVQRIYRAGLSRIYNYSTTNGTIVYPYIPTSSGVGNITITADTFLTNSYANYNFSSNLGSFLWQSELRLNATEIITNNLLTDGNFTIAALNSSNGTFYLNAGNYNITYAKFGYLPKTQAFTTTAVSNTTGTITEVGDQLLIISARNNYTLLNISSYNVSILGNGTTFNYQFNATANNITLLKRFLYDINATALQFFPLNYSLYNISGGFLNLSFISTVTMQVNFFNESTLSPMTNVTFAIVSELPNVPSFNGTTGNDSKFNLSGLTGNYEIRYSKEGYAPRSYFFVMPLTDVTSNNLSLYLIDTASSATIVAKVTDKNNQFIDGLTVSLLRRYVVNNQTVFYVVEQSKPIQSLQGQTVLQAIPNTIPYLFRVTDANNEILYQGSATTSGNYDTLYLISNQVFIKLENQRDVFRAFNNVATADVQLTNTSNAFWLSFSAINTASDNICLQVYKNNANLIGEQCSTEPSGIVSYTIGTLENDTFYTARATISNSEVGNVSVQTAIIDNTAKNPEIWGIMGLFILLIALVTFAFALSDKPQIMIIMMSLTFIAFSTRFLGFVEISPIATGTMLIVGIIIAVVMRD